MINDNGVSPPEYLHRLVEDIIGKKAVQWMMPDCGLSSALRFSVQFEDNSKFFVKAATDDKTDQWLRTEHFVLSSAWRECMPHVVHWIDMPGIRPVLITQDLSHAYWPANHSGVVWRDGDLDLLFSRIKELSSRGAPAELPALQNRKVLLWPKIENNPGTLSNLKLCSEGWIRRSVNTLIEAEKSADVTGDRLVHGDIRSDNVCFLGSKVIFVDWSHAARGSGLYDQALVLPTLHLEGGPPPYQIMPDGGREAALQCAGHIKRLIDDRSMPDWLKEVFRRLIGIELQWAAQCLGLDEPDGIDNR